MSIYEKLSAIQQELKAPKAQFNSFGNYNYRSCEDILEAVKPITAAHKTVLTLEDILVNIGDRYYIQARAKLYDLETTEYVETTAFAREEETKKGMDGSQVTGASSSYARKYALNGLFCIDDAKDSDFTNTGKEAAPAKASYPAKANAPRNDSGGEFVPQCKQCGTTITQKVHDFSVKKFGAPYCMNCQKTIKP